MNPLSRLFFLYVRRKNIIKTSEGWAGRFLKVSYLKLRTIVFLFKYIFLISGCARLFSCNVQFSTFIYLFLSGRIPTGFAKFLQNQQKKRKLNFLGGKCWVETTVILCFLLSWMRIVSRIRLMHQIGCSYLAVVSSLQPVLAH